MSSSKTVLRVGLGAFAGSWMLFLLHDYANRAAPDSLVTANSCGHQQAASSSSPHSQEQGQANTAINKAAATAATPQSPDRLPPTTTSQSGLTTGGGQQKFLVVAPAAPPTKGIKVQLKCDEIPLDKDLAYLNQIAKSCGALCSEDETALLPGSPAQLTQKLSRAIPLASGQCAAVFSDPYLDCGHGEWSSPTWAARVQPTQWGKNFTLQGLIPLRVAMYNHNTKVDPKKPPSPSLWGMSMWTDMIGKAKEGKLPGSYGINQVSAVRAALELVKERVVGKRVLILGSGNPWVEAILLAMGARVAATVEYAPIQSEHPQHEVYTPAELTAMFLENKNRKGQAGAWEPFDGAVSISSLEHTGLARYGDALNPWGDILAVAKAYCLTRDDGFLVIGVPFGHDVLNFNMHREYGWRRLRMMLTNWQPVNDETWIQTGGPNRIFALNKIPPTGSP